MEVLRDAAWAKPLPEVDATSAPFWEAAAEGRLLIQQCPACGRCQFYPRALCTACAAAPVWIEASGRGRVHTYTVVRQYGAAPFRDELPYVVAVIDLDEGVRMLAGLTGCAPDAVQVGMPVEAYAVVAAERVGVVYWRPPRG